MQRFVWEQPMTSKEDVSIGLRVHLSGLEFTLITVGLIRLEIDVIKDKDSVQVFLLSHSYQFTLLLKCSFV